MGQPAARLTDMHTCPMVTPGTPPIPHVGGPVITPGAPNVLIGGLPAATIGCMCTCVGPPDVIVKGSFGVLIGGRPAARMGDNTAHGGMVVGGLPTVLIGDVGMGAVNMEAPDLTLGDFLDGLHVALDIAGLIPVIGEIADGINALIYLSQGDFENAAISGISMIPMVGDVAKGGKYAYKASKSIPDVLKAVDKAKDAKRVGEVSKTNKELAEKYRNSRPSYGKNQVEDVWANAKQKDGKVYDPNTGEEIKWDKSKNRNGQWDMGHKSGKEYRKSVKDLEDGKITEQEFIDEYRNKDNYHPELPKNNRSGKYEQSD